VTPVGEDDEVTEDVGHPDEVPTLPQHSGFGSVWDSQIGVRSASTSRSVDPAVDDDEEFDEEPEVPEYLAAEKRQAQGRGGRGGRSGGRGGRSGGGYRSALDRERFGSASGSSSRAGTYSRNAGRGRSDRSHSPVRASAHAMDPIEQTPGGDPWSEVPPEVQALLKAEMARRESVAGKPATEAEAPTEDKPVRAPRKRSTKASASTAAEAEAPTDEG
jgi:hypothetical protein